jgi:hypothetical protein
MQTTAQDVRGAAGGTAVGSRHALVRDAVRRFVRRRLSNELAEQLLPGAPQAEGSLPNGFDAEKPWPALAAAYPALLETGQRKQRGTWYTPATLAEPTARRALAPLLASTPPRPLRIADPAVGGGAFLLAALRELRAAGVPARSAALCLHGVDIDGTAAALAALALWSAAELPASDLPAIAANVRAGDGLRELADGTFDAVLTNPPWETLQATAEAGAYAAALRPHFRCQGRGKLYTYRLFVERAHQLLCRGGRFGLVVPAALWSDRDAEPLRRLLLDDCTWEGLYGFENIRRVFPIDRRYRFAAIVGAKGGTTSAVQVAFGRADLAAWAAEAPEHTHYGRAQIAESSPNSGTLVEIDDERELDLLLRLQRRSVPLVGAGGTFDWRQGDFNMTGDRNRFVLRAAAERAGFRATADGCWRASDGSTLLPLYQGAMIGDLHPNRGAHRGGTGFQTAWETPTTDDDLRPCYLVAEQDWASHRAPRHGARIVLRALSNATNERSAIACLLPDGPCGNSLGVLTPRGAAQQPLLTMASGAAVLGSLPFDWSLRLRLAGTNLNGFVLAECRLPQLEPAVAAELARCALRLCAVLPWHAGLWSVARTEGWVPSEGPALTTTERDRLTTRIDVLAGRAFGFTTADVHWLTRDCDLPCESLRRRRPPTSRRKGFWRIDSARPPAARRPNRWVAALHTDDG